MANPQKENGFTAIAHEILEHLVKIPLLGSEFQTVLFIVRKTYGYQKKQDIISLSQFQSATGLSRPTVVKTIKNLMTRKMIVKIYLPDDKIAFTFNKNWEEWVVNTSKLVKGKWVASKDVLTKTSKDVLTHNRYKDKTKDIGEQSSQDIVSLIDAFKEVNPSYKKWFGNTTQRGACERLIATHGLERLLKVIGVLPKSNRMEYVPTITTPVQLEDKWASLESALIKKKSEYEGKLSKNKVAFS